MASKATWPNIVRPRANHGQAEEGHLLAWAGGEPQLADWVDHKLEPQLEEGPISNLDLEEETGDK